MLSPTFFNGELQEKVYVEQPPRYKLKRKRRKKL
jgi:hypothetical protein